MDNEAKEIIMEIALNIKVAAEDLEILADASNIEEAFRAIEFIRESANDALCTLREEFKHVDDSSEM